MVRKYRFADAAFVIAILLDFVSIVLLVDNKIVWTIIGVIAVGVAIAIRMGDPVTLNSMLLLFDFNAAYTIFGFIYSEINEIGFSWIIAAIVGSIVAMVSVLFMRVSASKVKGKVLAIIAFILIVCLCALLISFVANPAGNAVIGLFKLIADGAKWIGKTLYKVLEWLISLIPVSDEPMGELPQMQQAVGEADVSFADNRFGTVLAILVLAAAVISLIIAFFKMRLEKLPKYKAGAKLKVSKRKRTKLLDALMALCKAFIHAIKLFCYMMRSNALAKYYRLVFKKSFTKGHKLKSETPKEFLIRMESDINISEVNKMLYGN